MCVEEVFAPLVGLYPFDEFGEALARVNRSSYGLQAGVFTSDLRRTLAAFDALEVGGVIVNDVSAWRIDHMPYGGVKDSGLGREGLALRNRGDDRIEDRRHQQVGGKVIAISPRASFRSGSRAPPGRSPFRSP